jgi:hypothetical protein
VLVDHSGTHALHVEELAVHADVAVVVVVVVVVAAARRRVGLSPPTSPNRPERAQQRRPPPPAGLERDAHAAHDRQRLGRHGQQRGRGESQRSRGDEEGGESAPRGGGDGDGKGKKKRQEAVLPGLALDRELLGVIPRTTPAVREHEPSRAREDDDG